LVQFLCGCLSWAAARALHSIFDIALANECLVGACKSRIGQKLVNHIEVILLAVNNCLVVFLGLLLGGHVAADFAFHVFEGAGTRVELVLFEGSLVHLCCRVAQKFIFGQLSMTKIQVLITGANGIDISTILFFVLLVKEFQAGGRRG
jgi:hypothetical protein